MVDYTKHVVTNLIAQLRVQTWDILVVTQTIQEIGIHELKGWNRLFRVGEEVCGDCVLRGWRLVPTMVVVLRSNQPGGPPL